VITTATNTVVSWNEVAEVLRKWRAVRETNAAGMVSVADGIETAARQ
jgi:hypothetical protein